MSKQKKLTKKVLIYLLAGSSVLYSIPMAYAATSVVSNTQLPTGGQVMAGNVSIPEFMQPGYNAGNNTIANITQESTNAVIKWESFDVGGSATVNFTGPQNFNSLNYVNGGNLSQIYGTINANGGNIFLVNPAGVQIGNSAQINVGSLYVSNKKFEDEAVLNNINKNGTINDIIDTINKHGTFGNGELMSLGNINATNVTFEGNGRIVIDTDRIRSEAGDTVNPDFTVKTTDTGNVVLGYTAYDEIQKYDNDNKDKSFNNVYVGDSTEEVKGYMWVEDAEQLQAMNTNLSGNYALRNSIDATESSKFTAVGDTTTAFSGKLDGLGNNIFSLTVNGTDNVGLFGITDNAQIRNVNLIGGSIEGTNNVGALVGSATNTIITNVVNTASVTGTSAASVTGGIVGAAQITTLDGVINTGTIEGVNNVGGLVGVLKDTNPNDKVYAQITGTSYNLGAVKGSGHNVGGLVGSAENATIGDGTNLVYNRLDVTGAYNVGGIVGSMSGSTVKNAENSGNVAAKSYETGTYTFHTDYTDNGYSNGGTKSVSVNIANVGGITGSSTDSKISNVTNSGDVSSNKEAANDYYDAGNVGGIAGSAINTNITNAENKENSVNGAHNVGGIAGYFANTNDIKYEITNAVNNGGDIMATGARNPTTWVTETIRQDYSIDNSDGNYIIGNIGGIVGYMDGNNLQITQSGNRGTVHTLAITDQNNVSEASTAANAGGIVGKIDRDKETSVNVNNAAVINSYNAGNVLGYTAIGGIAGMMYNGGIMDSYNLGNIQSTRASTGARTPLNMGGIVGDTTENSKARTYLSNVYNAGTIGDENYTYKGRHVGGIAGRLSGTIEKSYNTGTIYNAAAATGGVVGYMSCGELENVFNTSNITVMNNDGEATVGTQAGGLVGAANVGRGDTTISNAYNLGSVRSFNGTNTTHNVGGIVGKVVNYTSKDLNENPGSLTISNVYTTGNLYADNTTSLDAIYGENATGNNNINVSNAVYISPTISGTDNNNGFTDLTNTQQATLIDNTTWDKFIEDSGPNVWRIYEGTTPILNAFMPNSHEYLDNQDNLNNITNVQYGTAYNPLLTIVTANGELNLDWDELKISGAAGLAVYGDYAVNITNFNSDSGSGYYTGTIYSDGALTINAKNNANIAFGSSAKIYGSSVSINNQSGDVTVNGAITATGAASDTGSITINGSEINIYGELITTQQNSITKIDGVGNQVSNLTKVIGIRNAYTDLPTVGAQYAISKTSEATAADINIEATNDANLYYGMAEKGYVHAAGKLTVTSTEGNVFSDSDLFVGEALTLNAVNGEALLSLTNIGQVQADDDEEAINNLHNFMNSFNSAAKSIILNSAANKITVDMWDDTNAFALDKYDITGGNTFAEALNNMYVNGNQNSAKNITYIEISNAEQLAGIQEYKNNNTGSGILGYNFALMNDIDASKIEGYQAIGSNGTAYTGKFDGRDNRIIGLKVTDDNAGIFDTIGTGGIVTNLRVYSSNFTGTNAGAIAGVNNGRIENITTIGNEVTATDNAGGIVGINNSGQFDTNGILTDGIDNVESTGSVIANNGAIAGGLVGTNNGGINNSFSDSAVTVVSTATADHLGGAVGYNTGDIRLVDSLGVTNGGTSSNVGGIIGTNEGNMYSGYNESIVSGHNNVGGIIGTNSGTVNNIVNATAVTGEDTTDASQYVGGLIGANNSGIVSNGRNNGTITGTEYVGGMVGSNAEKSTLTNLVNDSSAEITGENYVGGIAGSNAGTITAQNQDNLINRGSITGQNYVGGVAGENIGTIEYVKNDVSLNVKDPNQSAKYFGGVAGINGRVDDETTTDDESASGIITNATNEGDVIAKNAQFVGGIVGWNTEKGVLSGMGNSNEGRVEGADHVGGVIGQNDAAIGDNIAQTGITNAGTVIATNGGAGGLIGVNNADITNTAMTNKGEVHGNSGTDNSGTGGLIGNNNGDVTYSNMINEASATVTGHNNVGGLIGINTGNVEGGRDANNSYYAYKIYNNGVINVGTYTDNNNDGIYEFTASNGSNIGGLIGSNETNGSLTAGYNTGAINASGSNNVGGIVGSNAGTVDQVFNTVMTADGTNGAVTGSTNVGGIVGNNSGTLSNAYNTTEVVGTDKVGAIAGNNANSVSNVYNTWNTDNIDIIGYGTSATEAYNVDSNKQTDYSDLDFNNTWKIYEGNSNPLLSVFLTKISIDQDKLDSYMSQHKIYNTKEQQLTSDDITALINLGAIYVNGLTKEEAFEAFYNCNSLISSTEHTNAGAYSDWLYSGQIASSGAGDTFNPNNLGYDIDLTASIAKAQITVDLNDIERTYGDIEITNGEYGFTYGFNNITSDDDKNALKAELDNNLTLQQVNKATDDGALVDNGNKTNDAGDYAWTGTVNIADGYQGNYEFVLTTDQAGDNQSSLGTNGTTITTIGDSKVNRRQLSVNDIIANIVYGNQNNNGFTVSGGELINTVYDDDVKLDTNLAVTDANIVSGSDYANNKGNRVTADVGTYENSLKYTGLGLTGNDANNYYIADTATGTIQVTQATINVDLTDVYRTYGSTVITSGGYNVTNISGSVNGDNYSVNNFNVDVTEDNALTGNTSGKVTQDVGTYNYTGTVTSSDDRLNQNYNIVVNNSTNGNNVGTGDSSITKADLSITINDVSTVYGTAFNENNYNYTIDKLVNGDQDRLDDVKAAINNETGGYSNTAEGSNGKVTQDVGDYSLSFNINITNMDILKNYNITAVNEGKSTVTQKQISIGADNVQINLGQTPNYTGTDINGVLVNGDSFSSNYHYGVQDSAIEDTVGIYNNAIGIWIGNSFYDLSSTSNWTGSGIDNLLTNYDITFTPGTLTVSANLLPVNPPDRNPWDYLYKDNPFDRIRNFRERKAEINFVDGGMEI